MREVLLCPKQAGDAWKEVTVRCLCAAWRPLWPECVLQRDFEGFEELEEEAVVHEIVSLGNSMGLEVYDDDVEELVEEHSKELSTEELLELHKEQNETLKRSLTSEESGEDEDKEESRIIPAKDLKDAFFCWSKLSKLAEDYHPDVGSVQKAIIPRLHFQINRHHDHGHSTDCHPCNCQLQYCEPLARFLMDSVKKRLDPYIEMRDVRAAAFLDPKFKLDWLSSQEQKDQVLIDIKEMLEESEKVQEGSTEEDPYFSPSYHHLQLSHKINEHQREVQ
ncbi:Tigger transposable element-derived protein 1-like 165 [Homarus americanus]|uniref:Tigger transposable element-derived protein 1-like 165 n=1 Tax=Homarus americanus TaxID=6706 RepID=A0A8J5JZN8_HOMAM|nr:Tigger transposable element-derived protein 1-like 165 [Homarus americanus]